MKRILTFVAACLLLQGAVFAQKLKSVPEKDVKINYVKDFQKQVPECTNVQWWQVDSLMYKVTFRDADGSQQAMLFSNRGTEKHFFVDNQYCPRAIKDTISHMYPNYKLREMWVRKIRGKQSYQVRIAQMGGFLWWKKEKSSKLLNFEIDGKFINEE